MLCVGEACKAGNFSMRQGCVGIIHLVSHVAILDTNCNLL